MAAGWRRLLGRSRPAREPAEPHPLDAPGAAAPFADPTLAPLLEAIEAAALAVYAAHGLPTRRGHYRRGPRSRRWTFLGEALSPEERWTLMTERPPERGWRYGRLEAIGAHEAQAELREASAVLTGCARLRERLRHGAAPAVLTELALALEIGARWRGLRDAQSRRAESRLTLTPP